MWAWPPGVDENPLETAVRRSEVSEDPKPDLVRGEYTSTLRRVDYFLVNAMLGLLSDGDLSVNRIDPKMTIDVAEKLAWEAMDRAAGMTDRIMAGEGPE